MATIKEILEVENNRSEQNTIHLFQEGSFWRAYEQSAWLCVRCLHEFKATRRQMKEAEQTVVFVGFPLTSLDKWLPEESSQRAEGEKHLVITLPEHSLPDVGGGTYAELFEAWKDNVELSQPQKSGKRSVQSKSSDGIEERTYTCLSDVMKAILSYPLESKSPVDNILFLSHLKSQLSAMM